MPRTWLTQDFLIVELNPSPLSDDEIHSIIDQFDTKGTDGTDDTERTFSFLGETLVYDGAAGGWESYHYSLQKDGTWWRACAYAAGSTNEDPVCSDAHSTPEEALSELYCNLYELKTNISLLMETP